MPLTKVKKDVIQNLNANKVTGTFGANDGSALLGVSAIDHQLRYNLSQNFFNDSVKDSLNRYALDQGWIDTFEDTDDIDGEGVSVPITKFDGANDYLTITDGVLGQTDGKRYTISFWVQIYEESSQTAIFTCTDNRLYITREVNNSIRILCKNASGNIIVRVNSSPDVLTIANGLIHVAVAIDLANATQTDRIRLYINGVEDLDTITQLDDDTIDFTNGTVSIGASASGAINDNMNLGQFYLAEDYIDLSIQANREKFYKDGPVDLGSDGSKPLGTTPLIYLNNTYGSFQTNLGTGGNFSVTGQLVDGGYANGKTYSSKSFSNSYELIDSYGKENADTDVALNAHNSNVQQMFVGQCVTFTTAVSITKLAFEMSDSTGSGTGDVWAVIMGTTGTVGSTAVGDGNILAKSDHLDGGTLTTSASIQTFTFAEPIVLPAGDYFLGMSGQDTGTSSVHWAEVRSDNSSPTHSGNLARYNNPTSAWVADSGADCIFYAYGTKNLDLITKGSDDIGNSPSAAPTKGHMEVLLTEAPASGTSIFARSAGTNSSNGTTNTTYRTVLRGSDLSVGGDKIRIQLSGPASESTKLDNVSIVERSSGANGTTTPTEVLFGGSSGIHVLKDGTVWSDWFNYTLNTSKDYLVCFDITSDSNYDTVHHTNAAYGGFYWQSNADSHNIQNMTSPSGFTANHMMILSGVQVETKQTLNTDIIAEMSRDGGSTWDDVTMTRTSTNVGNTSNNILAGNVTFAATAGTNMVGRIRTVNKDKITVQGISVNWS